MNGTLASPSSRIRSAGSSRRVRHHSKAGYETSSLCSIVENDNPAMDLVAKQWTAIGDETNTAIELIHHTKKTGGADATVEDGRGAVALLAAVRSAQVLNKMTPDEGNKAGVENHRQYFKVENGKANLAPPP